MQSDTSSTPKNPKSNSSPVAQIFFGSFYDAGSNRNVSWMIRCECGYESLAESLEEAGNQFDVHIVCDPFGPPASETDYLTECRRHYGYAAGGGQ